MSFKKFLKSSLNTIEESYKRRSIEKYEVYKINKKKRLWQDFQITPEDLTKIQELYGNNVDTRWHKYYASFTGRLDPLYFPEVLFSTKLEWILNPYKLCCELEDKSLLFTMFGDVQGIVLPKTVASKSYGRYLAEDNEIINKQSFINTINDYLVENKKCIIKPTRDTSSGDGVKVISLDNYKDILSYYHDDFIIQEVVVNQDDLKKLNNTSLNTFRVMTYISNSTINVAPLLLRIGVGNNHVDNAHAGGIFVGVTDDGRLLSEAYSEYGQKHKTHPTSNIVFDGYKIEGVNRIINAAINCHKKLPQLGMISWDFTINKNGEVVLVEANLFGQSVWLPQIAHGKGLFRDDTYAMIDLLKQQD